MFIWAIFTLGYFIGVVFTLAVIYKREEVENTGVSFNEEFIGQYTKKDDSIKSGELYKELTKVNFNKNNNPSSNLATTP